jgi:hypothetical protein
LIFSTNVVGNTSNVTNNSDKDYRNVHIRIHVKYLFFFPDVKKKLEFSQQISNQSSNIFREYPSSGGRIVPRGQILTKLKSQLSQLCERA